MTAAIPYKYHGFLVLKGKRQYVHKCEFSSCSDAVGYFNQNRDDRFLRWIELVGLSERGGCVRLMFHAIEGAE